MNRTKFIKISVYRSAVTGQFVTKEYAIKHPRTTIKSVLTRQEASLMFLEPIQKSKKKGKKEKQIFKQSSSQHHPFRPGTKHYTPNNATEIPPLPKKKRNQP